MNNQALAKEFKDGIINTGIEPMIDRVEAQAYGFSYLWDGYMPCHVIATDKGLVDIADVETILGKEIDLTPWPTHQDVAAMIQHLNAY